MAFFFSFFSPFYWEGVGTLLCFGEGGGPCFGSFFAFFGPFFCLGVWGRGAPLFGGGLFFAEPFFLGPFFSGRDPCSGFFFGGPFFFWWALFFRALFFGAFVFFWFQFSVGKLFEVGNTDLGKGPKQRAQKGAHDPPPFFGGALFWPFVWGALCGPFFGGGVPFCGPFWPLGALFFFLPFSLHNKNSWEFPVSAQKRPQIIT